MGENNNNSRAPVDILTNQFKLNIHGPKTGGQDIDVIESKEFTVHQYRVGFEDKNASAVMKNEVLNGYRDAFFKWEFQFDGGSLLYCPILFTETEIQLPIQGGENGLPLPKENREQKKVTLAYIKTVSQDDPVYFQIYDLLIKHCMGCTDLKLTTLEELFYDSGAAVDLPDLKLKLWPGYKASIKPNGKALVLEVDVIHKVIHSEDLLTTIESLKKTHKERTSDKNTAKKLTQEKLRGSMVVGNDGKNCTAGYTIEEIQMDMTPKSPFGQKDGKSVISYYDHYKKEYEIKIQNKKQPLIRSQVKNMDQENIHEVVYLIPELLHLTGLTEKIRSNADTMKELQKYFNLDPAKRLKMIQKFVKKMTSSDQVKKTLADWGLSLDSSIVPCIKGEVLSKEMIVFANDKSFPTDEMNDWTKHAMENPMLVSVPLEKWIVITGERDVKPATDFICTMRKVATSLGLRIEPQLIMKRLMDVRYVNYNRTLEELTAPGSKYDHVQMVLCVLPNNESLLYNMIKNTLTKDYGIASQCIVAESLDKNDTSAAARLLIQMNTKLGGEPWKVQLPQEMRENVIVIGLDFTDNAVKTGVVVATINQEMTRYYSKSFEFWTPEKMHAALIEAIGKSIENYCETQKTTVPPSCVVLYRSNVDEAKIIAGEIETDASTLQKGLDKLYEDKYGSAGVKLVYIAIARRCDTRIIAHNTQGGGGEIENPAPGTVVKTVTLCQDKGYKEFFMVPTATSQGTARAIHYRVILDNKGMSPDQIEEFTYKLCHLYFNFTGTVNLPAVCKYAAKLAKLTTQIIPGNNANDKLLSLLHYL